MAFIGNTNITQAFTPAVDYFSGTGSATAFTLSRPVASVAQVQVVIDNVAQNPSSAYTVSSNTITFTSAPLSGTNNIYVYYTSPITDVIAPGQGTVNATSMASSTGTGAGVFQTSPTITTPVISSLSSASATALTLQSAGTTAVTIDTSQNVLVGTTTTTNNIRNGEKLAVVTTGSGTQGGASLTTYSGTGAGNGVIIDIQRSRGTTDGSMTAVASGDTLGYLLFRGSDGTSFQDSSYITGQVDGAVSGGTVPGRLAFITSGTERMRIDSSGFVYIRGTSQPTSPNSQLVLTYDNNNYYGIAIKATASGSGQAVSFYNNSNVQQGYIYINGSGTTTYSTSSDYRLKENIVPMTGALAIVSQLKPVTYKWKTSGADGQGFIAHELAEIVPDCVTGEKDAVNEDGNPVYQGIDTSFLVATLTAAIQELKAINDTQAETINALTARIEALENR